MALALFLTHLL